MVPPVATSRTRGVDDVEGPDGGFAESAGVCVAGAEGGAGTALGVALAAHERADTHRVTYTTLDVADRMNAECTSADALVDDVDDPVDGYAGRIHRVVGHGVQWLARRQQRAQVRHRLRVVRRRPAIPL